MEAQRTRNRVMPRVSESRAEVFKSLEATIAHLDKDLTASIMNHVHDVDKQAAILEERVAYVEKRIDDLALKINGIQVDLKNTGTQISLVHEMLSTHVIQEGRDRIGLLLGVLAALAGIYLPYIVKLPGVGN